VPRDGRRCRTPCLLLVLMNELLVSDQAAAALALLDAALEACAAVDLDADTDSQVVAYWRELETRRNRLAPIDQEIMVHIEQRGLPYELGYSSVVPMARDLLRLSASDAKQRQRAAASMGSRRGLTGEPLAPIYPVIAAAQASGQLGPTAAAVIAQTLDKLPEQASADRGVEYEQILVGASRTLDVDSLRKACQRVLDVEDPDGKPEDEKYRERTRDFWIKQRRGGSASFGGEATAELAEYLLAVIDALAKPAPEQDGARDLRTAGQRRHDALLDGIKGAMRAGLIRDASGITTTVILQFDEQTLATGEGTVTTGHGATVSMRTVSAWLDGGTRIVPIVLGPLKQVLATGRATRLFTEGQRLALIARDQGCSFPGCDVGPQWTEAHHVIAWLFGGDTVIGNGTLLCRFHHANFERLGWECQMIDAIPHWLPPAWLDATRTPRRNHAHDPASRLLLV